MVKYLLQKSLSRIWVGVLSGRRWHRRLALYLKFIIVLVPIYLSSLVPSKDKTSGGQANLPHLENFAVLQGKNDGKMYFSRAIYWTKNHWVLLLPKKKSVTDKKVWQSLTPHQKVCEVTSLVPRMSEQQYDLRETNSIIVSKCQAGAFRNSFFPALYQS